MTMMSTSDLMSIWYNLMSNSAMFCVF